MSHNSSQKSSQSQPSSQQTVSSDPSSQQTLSETSSRNSSQSSQPQVTFQQRTQRPTNNSPRRTNSRQRGFQPRTRGRPITRMYRGYPYDLPPREDVFSQKQPQLDLPPSREDISSQQLQLDLPPSRDILSSQQLQLALPSQPSLKRYRVPKSYAAAVSGVINPSRDPMKHEETETETGT